MSNKTALVLRATGAQGRAVTEHLLNAGWSVHALVKDPKDDRAVGIQKMGAMLFRGDLSDTPSIAAAIKGCDALFLNQMPSFAGDSEIHDASAILEEAKKASVKHVVYNTMLRLDDPDLQSKLDSSWGRTMAPGVVPKTKIEVLVKNSGLPWTIIRPGYFMTNLVAPLVHWMFPDLASGRFTSSYAPETILPLIDPYDIGAFVAAAFKDPKRFQGKIINLAGQKLSVEETLDEIRRVSGREIKTVYRTTEETEAQIQNPLIAGQVLTRGIDKFVDLEEVKTWGIPLTTFGEFLEKNKDTVVPGSAGAPAEPFSVKLK